MRANPVAKLGRGVGVWAKFWSGELGSPMIRAELIRGPWVSHLIQDTSRNTHPTPECVCGCNSERLRGSFA